VALNRSAPPGPVMLGFRPEHAAMADPGAVGGLAGEVYVVEPLGNETLLAIQVGDELINLRAPAGVNPAVGSACAVVPDRAHLHLFDTENGSAITADGSRLQGEDATAQSMSATPVEQSTEGSDA